MSSFTLTDDEFPDYYKVLGVDREATSREILMKYRGKALEKHPDKNGCTAEANKIFANINMARDTLTNESLRREYNQQLYWEEAGKKTGTATAADQEAAKARTSAQSRQQARQQPRPESTPYRDPFGSAEYHFSASSWAPRPPPTPTHHERPRPSSWATTSRPEAPFSRFDVPIIPLGDGTWANLSHNSHPIWEQVADINAQCAMLCNQALTIKPLIDEIHHAAARSRWPWQGSTPQGPDEMMRDSHGAKIIEGIKLLVDIMRFIGAGYVAIKQIVENIKTITPALASKEMERRQQQLHKVLKEMWVTEASIRSIGTQIVGRHGDATAIWHSMRRVCRIWDELIMLPDPITTRMEQTFRPGTYRYGFHPPGAFYPTALWKKSKKRPRGHAMARGGSGHSHSSSSDGIE